MILPAVQAHLKNFISVDIAEWICDSWQYLKDEKYHLVKAIKESDHADITTQAKKFLVLSRLA